MENLDTIINHVRQWRSLQENLGDGPLSPAQTIAFAETLKEKVQQISVIPEGGEGAKLIPYAGSAGGIASWKHAKALSENGDSAVFFISDTPGGKLLDSDKLAEAVAEAVGGNNEKMGLQIAKIIFQGDSSTGSRSPYGVGNVMALNDVVSQKLMQEMARGDVRTISHDAPDHSVFVQTELPALLKCKDVTAINGIPIQQLRDILDQTGSILKVNAAVAEASRNLMEGTRFTTHLVTGPDGNTTEFVASIDGTKLFAGSEIKGPVLDAQGAPEKVITAPQIALLTINKMDTAAFQDLGRNMELSSVLTSAAHRIESGTQSWFPLQDTNGNDVGSFEIVSSAPQSPPAPGTARLQFDLSQPEFQQDRAAQLSQAIHVAADQIATHDSARPVVVASPEGKTIGTLEVAAPVLTAEPASTVVREYESLSH